MTPQEKIELEVIRISIKTDVSRSLKTQEHTHEAFLRGLTLNFSRVLRESIAGLPGKMNYSERF